LTDAELEARDAMSDQERVEEAIEQRSGAAAGAVLKYISRHPDDEFDKYDIVRRAEETRSAAESALVELFQYDLGTVTQATRAARCTQRGRRSSVSPSLSSK
jgi:hypothetical protein